MAGGDGAGKSAADERIDRFVANAVDYGARNWLWLVMLLWLLLCGWLLIDRFDQVARFGLSDTDDNLRMAQVRAWLAGQDWYDLRQYRLHWPEGANIHWSRLVDLPIAGLFLLASVFVDGPAAERLAVAVAPLLPLLLLCVSLALVIRWLVDPRAWPLLFICLFFAHAGLTQFAPTRIDHHGWQLALLMLGLAGIADPERARGGLTLGLACALSLSIGLELMLYIALLGAAVVLFWIVDPRQRRRMATFAIAISGGTTLGFLLFASNDNRLAVCDALSPVWLSDALMGGALLLGLAWLSPAKWQARLALAALAGISVAAFHALAWPGCLDRLEGVSEEVYDLWLRHVREARPVTSHGWRSAVTMFALPVSAMVGLVLMAWKARGNSDRLMRIAAIAAPALLATMLLFWQSRTGPAAQLLAIPGAVALVWYAAPVLSNSRYMLVRTLGTAAVVLFALGALVPLLIDHVAPEKKNAAQKAVDGAGRKCGSVAAMAAVDSQPEGVVFAFADLSPRLILLTRHKAIAGPYHRNGEAIADSMKFFRGTADEALAIAVKYRADYVLTCPNLGQATVFEARAPNGFYVQLEKGRVPSWLEPIDLGADSPLRMWKIVRP